MGVPIQKAIFLISDPKIFVYGYLLELPHQGHSNI